MWRRLFLFTTLFIVSFSVRALLWIFDLAHSVNWVIYDLQYYVDNSILLLKSLFSGNLQIVKDFLFHPLLGFYTTSMTSLIFGNFLDKYHAGLLSPIIFSSLMCLTVYLIGEKIGGFKMGLISWLIATFDPYSIQFSTTFLDMPATFFSTLFVYFLMIENHLDDKWKDFLMGITAGLATSSKHIVVPIIILLLFFSVRKVRSIILILLSSVGVYLVLNGVKFVSLDNIHMMLYSSVRGGALGVPAVIYGPLEIGKPYTYLWYILTYLGLGYTGFGIAPFMIPVICFAFYIKYITIEKVKLTNIAMYYFLVFWVGSSLLPLFFLPRNYWTAESLLFGEKIVKSDVFIRIFYPYYYVISIPSLSVFLSYLILSLYCYTNIKLYNTILAKSTVFISRILESFIILFLALSPLAFFANTIFPFWDFLFVLLINMENIREPELIRLGFQSLTMITVLVIILFFILIILKKNLIRKYKKVIS